MGEDGKEGKSFEWLPEGCTALADGEYDAIVMGTGLTECIISGLLSVKGKKILHVDRNGYYGADTASVSLNNLYEKFRGEEKPSPSLGHSRDWNVDLVPKFIMACGNLVKILLHSGVTRYLDFKSIDGSYVYKDKKVLKVPATPSEALSSTLMGFFEKRKFRNFLIFLSEYKEDKQSTWFKGRIPLEKITTRELYAEWGLDENTQAFVGHAMALHRDDDYLGQPANITADAIKLYVYSLEQHGKSPYIYPMYGLGGMPEGFSRLCAIHGGTFMLNQGVDEIIMKGGKAWGIKAGDQVAKAPIVIGDPSYFDKAKSKVTGKVVRSICILDHPIANTDNAESTQIIIPARQVAGRRNDIYVCMVSYAHNVSSNGKFIAIVSTTVETNNPIAELEPGFALLGKIMERFDAVSELSEPIGDGVEDGCFISNSYDAASHFENTAQDVLSLYSRITNEELDMTISADMNDDDL